MQTCGNLPQNHKSMCGQLCHDSVGLQLQLLQKVLQRVDFPTKWSHSAICLKRFNIMYPFACRIIKIVCRGGVSLHVHSTNRFGAGLKTCPAATVQMIRQEGLHLIQPYISAGGGQNMGAFKPNGVITYAQWFI